MQGLKGLIATGQTAGTNSCIFICHGASELSAKPPTSPLNIPLEANANSVRGECGSFENTYSCRAIEGSHPYRLEVIDPLVDRVGTPVLFKVFPNSTTNSAAIAAVSVLFYLSISQALILAFPTEMQRGVRIKSQHVQADPTI